jgi:hypothetical protein
MPDNFSSSPADGTHIFDDFHCNSAVTTGLVGQLDWIMTTITGASTPSFVASPNGVMRVTSDGTTAHGEAFSLTADNVTLGGGDGVIIRGRFRMGTTLVGNNFRFGLDDSVTATDGTVGVFVTSTAGLLAFDVASANGDQSIPVTGVSTLTSGTTMVVDTWHDIELRLSGTNVNGGPAQIDCFVDGEHGGSIGATAGFVSTSGIGVLLGSTETMEHKIVHWDTGAGAAQVLDIDYYEVYIPRV